jgi:hypothetical protein
MFVELYADALQHGGCGGLRMKQRTICILGASCVSVGRGGFETARGKYKVA